MRDIQKYRYAAAGFLVIVVFILGILFSNLMDGYRAQEVRDSLQDDLAEMESRQLQLTYLQSSDIESCKVLEEGLQNILLNYNRRLGDLQQYKQNSFFNADRFQNIKHRYIVSGIRYWMFAQDLREECRYSPNTILFFTTTLDKEDCDECERMGRQLTLLKRKHRDQVLIFSIPLRMEDGLIDVLKRQYNVTEIPTIVINGEKKMVGYHSRREVERELNLTG